MRCRAVVLVAACAGPPAPRPATPPTVIRVFREVMIDASGDSHRTTFLLATTGDDARLVVTRERSSATRLDTPTAWAMVERATFFGPISIATDQTAIDLVDGAGRGMHLRCEPFAEKVMPAHARLVRRNPDCDVVDRDAWAPETTESVPALVCMRHGAEDDMLLELVSLRQITFVDAPGVEYVEERTDCKVLGSALRWR